MIDIISFAQFHFLGGWGLISLLTSLYVTAAYAVSAVVICFLLTILISESRSPFPLTVSFHSPGVSFKHLLVENRQQTSPYFYSKSAKCSNNCAVFSTLFHWFFSPAYFGLPELSRRLGAAELSIVTFGSNKPHICVSP